MFVASSRTDRLLFLREALKGGHRERQGDGARRRVSISRTAHVRALEISQFLVANADALLAQDPTTLLYVSAVRARRLEGANQALIELKTQPASRAALSTKRLRRWKDCSVPAVPLSSIPGSHTGLPVRDGGLSAPVTSRY